MAEEYLDFAQALEVLNITGGGDIPPVIVSLEEYLQADPELSRALYGE